MMEQRPVQDLVTPWRPKSPISNIVFIHANVIDPINGTVLKDVFVHVVGDLIRSVSETVEIEDKQATTIIDLEGKFICPGLIDCHVHITIVPGAPDLHSTLSMAPAVAAARVPYVAGQMLDRGFTSIRDCAGAQSALKQAIAENAIRGPRLFISGHALSQTGGHGDTRSMYDQEPCCGGHLTILGRLCDGVPECMKAAREEIRRGADFIKIMAGGGVASPSDGIHQLQFSEEEISAIVKVANNAGTYVTAHAYTPRAIRQVVALGVRGIEHGNLIDEPTAQLMAEKGVFLTPTLITYAAMETPPFADFLPPASAVKNKEILEAGLRSLRIASEAGVTICYGSDLLGPLQYAQTHEFQLRRQALTDLQILQSATTNAAKMMQQDNLGNVKPGYLADFLILNKNPLDDVTILDRPDENLLAVVKDGRVVSSRWSKVPAEATHPLPQIA
ncbi:amidohydrolase [Drepanopeziza brunnea f. sp. 'multigermtubi' MB_m1]|uniref:Amidohydrolase n=2 Tax=Drepanopeziza brunnea f. sp. 'multigermtubi' TaxID=698441 RepID=K1WRJ3_MARBU|nr:amidohydrolase [Drepanopeziza brunnea f. sp. 'multigermtubi' MB_m1]EKD15037.1 amidohydrolase [Drepanopeziza brunnea f. sp. 'multigermtubi' MB_m1]